MLLIFQATQFSLTDKMDCMPRSNNLWNSKLNLYLLQQNHLHVQKWAAGFSIGQSNSTRHKAIDFFIYSFNDRYLGSKLRGICCSSTCWYFDWKWRQEKKKIRREKGWNNKLHHLALQFLFGFLFCHIYYYTAHERQYFKFCSWCGVIIVLTCRIFVPCS